MKFILDAEQRLFAETLRRLLADADVPKTARAWAAGTHEPGRALWSALAEAGVFAVAVPEEHGGAGLMPVELVTAAVELGRAGVPGPWAETLAAAQAAPAGIADGTIVATLALAAPYATHPSAGNPYATHPSAGRPYDGNPQVPRAARPYAPDADLADRVYVLDSGELRAAGVTGPAHASLDPARRLFPVAAGEPVAGDAAAVFDLGALVCAAQLAGLGRALLEVTVSYAKARQQFGRPIGEFQAVKHHLATALVALEHTLPLVYGAALAHGTPDFPRDVSAAKAAASDAAQTAARTALQVHGAIGYTDEYDPSLLTRKARALNSAWGTPAWHRARVLAALT